ncbi:hypothetical protein EDB86DRAFT_3246234 [Lactarius hatsudake]|nr:hypothetical protein EDB86DRAFT_3246234 [Lactarius hatsudake]
MKVYVALLSFLVPYSNGAHLHRHECVLIYNVIPAYEWNFSDVNPPVHVWATFRVFKVERKLYGHEDVPFLERVFQTLLLNFTWWVNCKDAEGANVFERGFIGLDNIGVFNRSCPPEAHFVRQTNFQRCNDIPDFEDKHSLWNEHDGMFYDAIQWGGHRMQPVRSLVGFIPLYATLTLESSVVSRLPGFKK